jgi:hypothetical protein
MAKQRNLRVLNTSSSYLLRMTLVTQIALATVSFFPTLFAGNILLYQRAAYSTLYLIPALLLLTTLTPSRQDRRSAKTFDLISSVLWLSFLGSFIVYGLRHCSDC